MCYSFTKFYLEMIELIRFSRNVNVYTGVCFDDI